MIDSTMAYPHVCVHACSAAYFPPHTYVRTQFFDRLGHIGLFIFEARPAVIDHDGIPFGIMLRVEPCPPSRHLCAVTSKHTRIQDFRQPAPLAMPSTWPAAAAAAAAAAATGAAEGQAGAEAEAASDPPLLLALPGLATVTLSPAADGVTQPLSLPPTDPSFTIFDRRPPVAAHQEQADDGSGASSADASPSGAGVSTVPPLVGGVWKSTADSPPPLYVPRVCEGAAAPETRELKKPRRDDGSGSGSGSGAGGDRDDRSEGAWPAATATPAAEVGGGSLVFDEQQPPVLDESVLQMLAKGWESE